jgi:hypothetical protein
MAQNPFGVQARNRLQQILPAGQTIQVRSIDRDRHGLYGQMWIAALEACSDWVRDLIRLRANKRAFFQKGLRAMNLIQATF